MSSHHIVRDDQEPALILGASPTGLTETVLQLLEWSPRVIVLKEGATMAKRLGCKIDAICAPEYILQQLVAQFADQEPFSKWSRADPLNETLERLRATGAKSASIILESDDPRELQWDNRLPVVVYTPGWRWVPIQRGWKKWLPQGQKLNWQDKSFKTDSAGYVEVEGSGWLGEGL